MSDLITVGATGIRTQLLSNPQIAAAVLSSAGNQYKIFLRAAPGNVDVPYILLVHIWGGDTNQTPRETFDMLWRVSVVTSELPDGEDLAALVRDQLFRQKLPYPDGWTDYAGVTFTGPYMELKDLQNVQFWEIGTYLRLRGNKQLS